MANCDGAEHIVYTLGDYSAPETADSMYQDVVRLPQSRRMGRTFHEYVAEFDLQPRKAGSEMQVGAGFLGAYVPVL